VLSDCDSDEDEIDTSLVSWALTIETRRYLSKRVNDKFKAPRFHHFLVEIKPTRFRKLFRVERRSFHRIVQLILSDATFEQLPFTSTKRPIEHHLLVFLYYLGANGNAVSNEYMASFFGIGAGTISSYIARVTDAVVRLRDQFILWPNHAEACDIAMEVNTMCGFAGCVGFIDGTLFPLEFKHCPRYCFCWWALPWLFLEAFFCRVGSLDALLLVWPSS
jgi:hypothetical protein